MSLRSVDLNLLPVLQRLLREKSVSRAALGLGLTQSATSAALGRLRATLNDPLLVRVGGGMQLTPAAVALIEPLEVLCEGAETFFIRKPFDPATQSRTFVIATSDYATLLVAGPLMKALETQAPGISLRFVDVNERLTEHLATRDIDLAILPSFFVEDLAPVALRFRPLLHDESVALFRAGHPLDRCETLSREDVAPYRMISFHPSSDAIESKRAESFQGGKRFDAVAFVPQVTLLPFLLADTDYFAIVPRRLANRVAPMMGLSIRSFAFPTQSVDMGLTWSPVQDTDAAHRWLRRLAETLMLDERRA